MPSRLQIGGDVGEDVERAVGLERAGSRRSRSGLPSAARPSRGTAASAVARSGWSFLSAARAGQLHERRRAGERGVDHLADRVGDLRGGDGEAQPPAAHAVRLAERVGRHALIEHAGLRQQRVVRPLPDHVAVRLVAEDGDVLAADEIGDASQVFLGGDAAGRIVRGVQEDGLRRRVCRRGTARSSDDSGRNSCDCMQRRADDRPRPAALDVRHIGRESTGLKTSTPSPGLRNASQKNCSKTLAPGPTTMFSAFGGNAELAFDELGGRLAELRQPRRRAVVRCDSSGSASIAARLRRRGALERAVADLEFDDVLARRPSAVWRPPAR